MEGDGISYTPLRVGDLCLSALPVPGNRYYVGYLPLGDQRRCRSCAKSVGVRIHPIFINVLHRYSSEHRGYTLRISMHCGLIIIAALICGRRERARMIIGFGSTSFPVPARILKS